MGLVVLAFPSHQGTPHALSLSHQQCCSPAGHCRLSSLCTLLTGQPPGHLCEILPDILSPTLVCFLLCFHPHLVYWLSLLEHKFQKGHLICPMSWEPQQLD